MSKKQNVWITHRPKGWAVIQERNQRASKLTNTQKEAINAGKEIAQSNQSELRIQGTDGKIRETRSYGNDPFPPRDRK